MKNPTESQIRRLYAIATSHGWTRDGVKRMIEANYGIKSTKELDAKQYEKVCDFLEKSLASDVATMNRDPNTIDMFGKPEL